MQPESSRRTDARTLKSIIATTMLAICAVLWVLLDMHSSPFELTRTRNALIAEVGDHGDFAWTPENPPNDFLLEDRSLVPSDFLSVSLQGNVSGSHSSGNWETSLRAARHLAGGPGTGEGIRSNTRDTYKTIMSENMGYCSDYTQVFNGIAIASGVPVREWGLSFDSFSGDGHAFNEIYDPALGKWIFIDTFNSFYVIDAGSGTPLSVLEFRDHLRSGDLGDIEVQVIVPERFTFSETRQALEYYRDGADEFFLYFGNNVFSYDSHPVTRILGSWSRALEQSAAIITGVQPRIRIVASDSNQEQIDALFRRRNLFVAYIVALAGLGLALLFELRVYRRR